MTECPSCKTADVVRVDLALRGGAVAFRHCRSCEYRWWTDGEHRIALDTVLSRASAA